MKIRRQISEDAMRRGLGRMEAAASEGWCKTHLMRSVSGALDTPWIPDIDTTIKVLYGNQQGAGIGFNPHKPGRPSHALHACWVGDLHLVLDVVVSPGKQASSSYAQPGLTALLDGLAPGQNPALVRGDCGMGNDPFILELDVRKRKL
ncbi:MAG: transposase [Nitrosomonadales bacterium]|nr:transposase [Nitrosomonadales bacterium]